MPAATILHADLDAFFAAVEQRDNPELRGRPVIVGGDPGERGVVTAASYEARRFGVHSAMPSAIAQRLCPKAIFVRPRHVAYSAVSKRIMSILRSITPLVEPLSLDEAFLDVAGCERSLGTPVEIARTIKRLVLREEKLTISIGIATSKSVAKIASDISKPDGLLVVPTGTEREFLAPLPVSNVWGVGPKTRGMLEDIGIKTIGDLADQTASDLSGKFGRNGHRIRRLAIGIDERSIEPDHQRKSLGHETTFERDIRDPSALRVFLLEASEKVAKRLRAERIRGRVVTLKLRIRGFHDDNAAPDARRAFGRRAGHLQNGGRSAGRGSERGRPVQAGGRPRFGLEPERYRAASPGLVSIPSKPAPRSRRGRNRGSVWTA